jgi:hypothetical protein
VDRVSTSEEITAAAKRIRQLAALAEAEIRHAYFSDYQRVARAQLAAPLGDYAALMHPGAGAALAAIQGAYVPPPPGSDRDALPEDIRRLIEPSMRPYTSTACETARACFLASEVFQGRADELLAWAERQHAACRITRKQDMARCVCDCHEENQ